MNTSPNSVNDLSANLEAAIAIHREGRKDEAEVTYREVLAAQPDHPEALHMLGVVHLQNGRLEDARQHFQAAIERNGADARYYNNLGNALMGLGQREGAIDAFQQALDRNAGFLIARCNRGTALVEARRNSEAAREFATVLDEDPCNRTALNNFGALLMKQNRIAEACKYFRKGLEQYPDDVKLLSNLGVALERLNQLDEAETVARRALEISPAEIESQFLLARLDNRAGRHDKARIALKSLLAQPLGQDLAIDAWFEMGRVLDRVGETDEALAAFRKANELDAASLDARPVHGALYLARIPVNRDAFTHERLLSSVPANGGTERVPPVFFVGFPRSGTTLMERALAAHPAIVTTEEDSPLAMLVERLSGTNDYAAAIDRLTENDLDNARGTFWSEAQRSHGLTPEKQLVDKLPLNIVDLGYANLLFPNGNVVVALRDPRDVCLSCFMQRFRLNDGMSSFVDFGETVRAYEAVMGLWLHYRETLSIPRLEYRYEELVEDLDGTVRRVLEFIGLDWHPSIASYREQARQTVVKTPSYRDVTSHVYERAVGRWRHYRELLDPYADTLRPFVAAFGYPTD